MFPAVRCNYMQLGAVCYSFRVLSFEKQTKCCVYEFSLAFTVHSPFIFTALFSPLGTIFAYDFSAQMLEIKSGRFENISKSAANAFLGLNIAERLSRSSFRLLMRARWKSVPF